MAKVVDFPVEVDPTALLLRELLPRLDAALAAKAEHDASLLVLDRLQARRLELSIRRLELQIEKLQRD